MFGDYYYFGDHHNAAKWEDQQGFWFRRIYFTYDQNLGPKFMTRFRLEANSNGRLAGGSLTPYVKDAYLRWNYIGRQQMFLGISPTTTFEFIESFWGLRHIEKTPDDLYRLDSSRDFGVTLSGPLNDSQTLKYAFQVGNDASQNSETNKYKGVRFAVRYEKNPGFVAEAVYNYLTGPLDADRQLAQGFVGYQHKRGRAGFQYTWNERKAATTPRTPTWNWTSGRCSGCSTSSRTSGPPTRATTASRIRSGRRRDRLLELDPRTKFGLAIAGIEYSIIPQVRISPNVEWATTTSCPTAPRSATT